MRFTPIIAGGVFAMVTGDEDAQDDQDEPSNKRTSPIHDSPFVVMVLGRVTSSSACV